MANEPIQTDEVVARLSRFGECAIVHLRTGVEVWLSHEPANEREPYSILARLDAIPSNSQLGEALQLGFVLRRSVDDTAYELERRCFGARAAAHNALILARVLAGSSSDERFWLTSIDHDRRDESPAD